MSFGPYSLNGDLLLGQTGPIHEDWPWSVGSKVDVLVQGQGNAELRVVVFEVGRKRQILGVLFN